jgi:hypothetical protein
VIISDTLILIGCQTHKIEDWRMFSDSQIKRMDCEAAEFWATWKTPILAMADAHTALVEDARIKRDTHTDGETAVAQKEEVTA